MSDDYIGVIKSGKYMDLKEFAKGLDEEALFYLPENDNSRPRAFANSLIERLKDQLGIEDYTNAYAPCGK